MNNISVPRGDVEMPKTQWLGDIPGFSRDQLLAYGDARALAASEQYRADAERYQWIKNTKEGTDLVVELLVDVAPNKWNETIDAAMGLAMKRGEA